MCCEYSYTWYRYCCTVCLPYLKKKLVVEQFARDVKKGVLSHLRGKPPSMCGKTPKRGRFAHWNNVLSLHLNTLKSEEFALASWLWCTCMFGCSFLRDWWKLGTLLSDLGVFSWILKTIPSQHAWCFCRICFEFDRSTRSYDILLTSVMVSPYITHSISRKYVTR